MTGPEGGHFSAFKTVLPGSPEVVIDTSDGLDPEVDQIRFPASIHDHFNYAFTKPGYYTATFQITAVNISDITLTSRPFVTHWSIGEHPGFVDSDGNGLDDNWEATHGFVEPADPSADPDDDGKNHLEEFLHGTDPNLFDTVADRINVSSASTSAMDLRIQALPGRMYRLFYSDDLIQWKPGSEKILAPAGPLSFRDDGTGLIPTFPGQRFYRIQVSSP